LYNIANTQSQPKIDTLSAFYREIGTNPDKLVSFKEFINLLNPSNNQTYNFNSLFEGMRKQNGWGDKTAALFVKSVYHINSGEYGENLKFWDDCPSKIDDNDKFFLPVDAVIIAIFKEINPNVKRDFKGINKFLKDEKNYSNLDIEIWDDLWFWGFITQKGSDDNRSFGWNDNKYWNLFETNKDAKEIEIIEEKANEFLNILLA